MGCRLQHFVLGRCGAPVFGHAPRVPSLRSTRGLHAAMQRKQPCLLFLHLSGSARCERAAGEVAAAARRLRGAVFVAAIDVAALPALAAQLTGGAADAVPLVVLLQAQSARPLSDQPEADQLVAEGLAALGAAAALQPVCTAAELRTLLRRSPRGAAVALHGRLPPPLREALRASCAASGLACVKLSSASRCDAAAALADDCDGDVVTLSAAGRARRCWRAPAAPAADADRAASDRAASDRAAASLDGALRAHAATERHGALFFRPALLLRAGGSSAPVRFAVDITGAAASAPLACWAAAHAAPLAFGLGALVAPGLFSRWRAWQRGKAWRDRGYTVGRGRRAR